MDSDLPSAETLAQMQALTSFDIDLLQILRWAIYLLVLYRALDIFITYGSKASTKERITHRYEMANSECLTTFNREERELMMATIRNTLNNVKISSEGLPPKPKKAPPKRVMFSGANTYYPPPVYTEEEGAPTQTMEIETSLPSIVIPVPTYGEKMPPAVDETGDDTLQPDPAKLQRDLATQFAQLEQQVKNEAKQAELQEKVTEAVEFLEKVVEPFKHHAPAPETSERNEQAKAEGGLDSS